MEANLNLQIRWTLEKLSEMKTGIASYFPTDVHFKIDKIWLQVLQGGNQAVIQIGMIEQPQMIKGGK